ncbi:MAG: hypothetical protein ABSG25_05325 [Bryobacteraceae bacterium]
MNSILVSPAFRVTLPRRLTSGGDLSTRRYFKIGIDLSAGTRTARTDSGSGSMRGRF